MGNQIFLGGKNYENIDTIPVANYRVCVTMQGEFYIEQIAETFKSPKDIYGDIPKHSSRIINTFLNREVSTGVLLAGEKGSGKSLLAKKVCEELNSSQNIPTIMIESPFCGAEFNNFVSAFKQRCVFFFDEFEKTYDRERQESLLTLFDGMYNTNHLFLLTCNEENKLDYNLKSRPGRIFYYITFGKLSKEFIREYCEKNLTNKQYVKHIIDYATICKGYNFDSLKAIVDETNMYDESVFEFKNIINVDKGNNYSHLYENFEQTIYYRDKKISQEVVDSELTGLHNHVINFDIYEKETDIYKEIINDIEENYSNYFESYVDGDDSDDVEQENEKPILVPASYQKVGLPVKSVKKSTGYASLTIKDLNNLETDFSNSEKGVYVFNYGPFRFEFVKKDKMKEFNFSKAMGYSF